MRLAMGLLTPRNKNSTLDIWINNDLSLSHPPIIVSHLIFKNSDVLFHPLVILMLVTHNYVYKCGGEGKTLAFIDPNLLRENNP